MFTGIIQSIGKVARLQRNSAGLNLSINCGTLPKKISPSDSVAINGVCLTATECAGQVVSFDVVKETINRTNLGKLRIGEKVNLELAIRAGEAFGGHFVQGHIDGTGIISRKAKTPEGYILEIKTTLNLINHMIEKGSIAIDGISLTVVSLKKDKFTVALIHYTLSHTNLGEKSVGATVNLEVDIIGKWVRKIMETQSSGSNPKKLSKPSISLESLL